MMSFSDIFTAVFIVTAGVSLVLGTYILHLKQEALENQIFFAVAFALAFWAAGLGMALSAPSEELSIMWRRIAALGWGTFFSFLLHFTLALTGKNTLLKRWWAYGLLYLPAAVNIMVFAIPAGLNPTPFIMVQTNMGWTNVAENNAWDIYYMICYISMMAASLAILWRWGIKSPDKAIKRQSKIMFTTFIAAALLGTVSDMLMNTLLAVKIPQIAPVWILVPVMAIYLTMNRYGMLNHSLVNTNEEILTSHARQKIYRYMTFAALAGGALYFLTRYVLNSEKDLLSTLIITGGFLLIGALIQIINRLNINNRMKDFICMISASHTIPIVLLGNLQNAGVTVWAFPFILVIISLVFNKRTMLYVIAFLTLISLVIVWVLAPESRVSQNDFAGRIGIFIIGISLAFYVNRIYIGRLKNNAQQARLQKLVSEISMDFVSANQENIDDKTMALLAKTGTFFGTDRAYACFFDKKNRDLHYSQIWDADETAVTDDGRPALPASEHLWWMDSIMNREVVNIPDFAKQTKEIYGGSKIDSGVFCSSMISIPIMNKESVLGFINFENINEKKVWKDEDIALLKVLANTLADAKAKTEAEKEINCMAYYDHMTGLPNRQLFNDRLTQSILNASRTNRRLGVIFLDLDSFKTVNDTLGHERGDELLRIIAERMQSCVRQSDTVSRFGGDEFLMLINSLVRENDIVNVAEKIMKIFRNPFVMTGQEFYVTASIGIAMYPADGDNAEKLIKNADIAMYHAKESGKNQYAICSHELKEAVNSNVTLTTSLYRALERDELIIYYQPQVNLHTNRITGMEALLRWKNPEHGMISPDRFIPLAEQTGLINPIGEWVLQQACNQNMKWQQMGLPPVRIAVNLSVIQLRNPRLKDIVRDTLEETGLHPSYLELEVTESAATTESDYIIKLLGVLKSLGISLSIDDFGTEYSSLSRLKMLPVDRIKMDIQFVRGIEESDKDKAIAKVIINLAKNLGLKVIAEGVETERQLNFLRQKMCDEVQGFYYYRPMPADQVELVLKSELQLQDHNGTILHAQNMSGERAALTRRNGGTTINI